MLVKDFLLNLPGTINCEKTVFIQSDDWGSIRVPSNAILKKLSMTSKFDCNDPYAVYDTLADSEDLECLLNVLSKVKNDHGKNPVFEPNFIVSNPDFNLIRKGNFKRYYQESLRDTFARYSNLKAMNLWHEGIRDGIFIPQFHGREHVNISFWLEMLQKNAPGVRSAFDSQVFGLNFYRLPKNQKNFQRAWDVSLCEHTNEINDAIIEGIKIFQSLFGYAPVSMIAPNYTWNKEQEDLAFKHGIKIVQGILRQRVPNTNVGDYAYKYRFTSSGKHNQAIYLRRNVFFEPTLNRGKFDQKSALRKIEASFLARKPAVISTHRLNFIGSRSLNNRANNIILFESFLNAIVKKWPDVSFMSSKDFVNERNK